MEKPFAHHALVQPDGTGFSSQERLDLALSQPAHPAALTQAAVRGVTQNRIRNALSDLAHGQLEDVRRWMLETGNGIKDNNGNYIVKPDPKSAVELFMGMAEYALPKLKSVAVDVRTNDQDMRTVSLAD